MRGDGQEATRPARPSARPAAARLRPSGRSRRQTRDLCPGVACPQGVMKEHVPSLAREVSDSACCLSGTPGKPPRSRLCFEGPGLAFERERAYGDKLVTSLHAGSLASSTVGLWPQASQAPEERSGPHCPHLGPGRCPLPGAAPPQPSGRCRVVSGDEDKLATPRAYSGGRRGPQTQPRVVRPWLREAVGWSVCPSTHLSIRPSTHLFVCSFKSRPLYLINPMLALWWGEACSGCWEAPWQ